MSLTVVGRIDITESCAVGTFRSETEVKPRIMCLCLLVLQKCDCPVQLTWKNCTFGSMKCLDKIEAPRHFTESLRKKKNKADEGNPVMWCDGLRKSLYRRLRLDRSSRDPNGFECRPDTHYWIKAESIANNLVQEFKDKMVQESPPVAPIILKELRVELMCGHRYRMHFQVTHEKGITSNYYAKARIPPGPPEKVGVEYKCLERVIRPGNSKKEKKVVTLFTTEPPLTLNENVFNGIDEGTIELLFGKNKHRLRALGFNLLLKEIKDQSMECETYAKVRKRASRKWREIGEVKRLCYMRDVAVKREEEWFKENNGLSVMHST